MLVSKHTYTVFRIILEHIEKTKLVVVAACGMLLILLTETLVQKNPKQPNSSYYILAEKLSCLTSGGRVDCNS